MIAACCLLALCLAFISCGGEDAGNKTPAYSFTFIYGNVQSKEHPRSLSMIFFRDLLEKSSGGRIKVELHFGGQLGKEEEVLDMVKHGIIQGCRGGLFERANKKYILYTLPFMFRNTDQVLMLMESDFGREINRDALENGYYIPACGVAGGFRNITTNSRPVKKPDDLRGLKIRMPPLEMSTKTFSILGALPQQITYTDTYLALKGGVVDGQENPFSNIVDMKFYEVQRYLSLVNWQIHPDPFYVNPEWHGSLPADLKKIFDEAAQNTVAYSNKIWLESEYKYLELLRQKLSVSELTTEETATFARAVKSVWQYYINLEYFTNADLAEAQRIIGD